MKHIIKPFIGMSGCEKLESPYHVVEVCSPHVGIPIFYSMLWYFLGGLWPRNYHWDMLSNMWNITNGLCLFCTMPVEHNTYHLITCSMSQCVRKYIFAMLDSIITISKSPIQLLPPYVGFVRPSSQVEPNFHFLRYWGFDIFCACETNMSLGPL